MRLRITLKMLVIAEFHRSMSKYNDCEMLQLDDIFRFTYDIKRTKASDTLSLTLNLLKVYYITYSPSFYLKAAATKNLLRAT